MQPASTQTASGTNALSTAAYNQGQTLQNQYNSQAAGAKDQYNSALGQANSTQGDLSNYTKQIAGLNYGNIYGQDLTSAQQMYGFDPTQLMKANQNLATTQTTLANLPQAVQQQGNYYGTTAGSEAANYSGMAGNVNNVLAGQGNAVNAYQNVLAATQQQANQQTTQQLAGQQQALSGFQGAASNASQILATAGTTMNQIEQLQQQQGYLTAQQVAAYQNAYSTYVSAQGAAAAAYASANNSNAQAGYTNQETTGLQQSQALAAQQAAQKASQAKTGSSASPSNSSSILSQAYSGSVNNDKTPMAVR